MVNLRPNVVLTVILCSACAQEPPEWAGRVVEEEGVLRVENPAQPLAGPEEVGYEFRWRHTGPERGAIWEVPRKLHLSQGIVFLVDRQASRIHRLTAEGGLLPSLGEAGAGPGQYRRIIDAIPTESGLFVVDGGNARVEVLSDEGGRIASHPLDRIVFSAVPLGDDGIMVFWMRGPEEGWLSLNVAGEIQSPDFPDLPRKEGETGPISRGSTWGERLVRLRFTTPLVRLYSPTGVLEKEIEIPLPEIEATDQEIEEIVNQVSSVLARDGLPSGVIQQQVDLIRTRPREKLRFRKIDFDEEGGLAAIWEQNPEDYGSGNATLYLLTVEGIYLAKLEFDRPWADFDLEDRVLYVLSRDPETDLATVLAHDIRVPQRLLDRARDLTTQASGTE